MNQNELLDYSDIERQIAQACRTLECAIHEQILGTLNIDAERLLIGGALHRKVMSSEGVYHSQAGDCRVKRTLYRPLDDNLAKAVDTVSLRAGCVGDGWLPATATSMAFLLQQNPSRDCEKTAEETGRLL
jgi:hypothetical protein